MSKREPFTPGLDDYISLDPILHPEPLDAALEVICDELGIERPGGRSTRGWSMRSTLMQCPWKFKRIYIDGDLEGSASAVALETGGLYHQLLAFYYLARMERMQAVDTEWMKRRLLDLNVTAEVVMEGFRLYEAYISNYHMDYVEPLAVEQMAEDKDGNSCRYDLIARVDAIEELNVMPGVWVIEHKTAGRFDTATLEGWKNDGQLIQQMMIWQRCRLDKKYGKLQGIIVNMIRKGVNIDFRRIVIPPVSSQIKRHAKDLQVWDAMENFFRATSTWPKARSACVGRYGLCPLFDECSQS